jgi:C4-dicarboxylate-specific signal transduction histidine kinase
MIPPSDVSKSACGARFNPPPAEAIPWILEFVHEINQPLASLLTAVNACQRSFKAGRFSSGEASRSLERIAFLGERVAGLVSRLREHALGSAPRLVGVDLHTVLQDALRTLAERIRTERVKVEIHFGEDIPLVRGEEVRLGEVALNLLRNALDAMQTTKANQRRLTLTTRREGNQVEALIGDTGPGISMDLIERLFEPMPSAKSGGMGIGLAISREILNRLGGSLSAQSLPERGSMFCFSVPIWKKEKTA